MKTHIPNRVALASEFSAKKRNVSRLRRVAIAMFSLLGGLMLIGSVVTLIATVSNLRRERDVALAGEQELSRLLFQDKREAALVAEKNLQLLAEINALKDELSFESSYIEFLELELEHLKSQLKQADEQESKKVQSSLEAVTAERDAALESIEILKRQHQTIMQQHLDNVLVTIAPLRSDPSLFETELRDLKKLADANGLDSGPIEHQLRALPKSLSISPKATVVIHSVNRENGTVIIDFSVQDDLKKRIEGLTRRDVEVLDGSRRIHAVEMTQTTAQIGQQYLAVLLDFSGSMEGAPRDAMVDGARMFFRAMVDSTRIKVWTFANDVFAVSPWTIDSQLHEAAIQNIRADGATALYKGLRVAVDDLKSQSGKRSIILFTDGSDSFQQESLDAVLGSCREAQIGVHVVALRTGETKYEILQRIASDTQGTIQEVDGINQIASGFAQVAQTLKEQLYRLRISEPLDSNTLALTVGNLAKVDLKIPAQQ